MQIINIRWNFQLQQQLAWALPIFPPLQPIDHIPIWGWNSISRAGAGCSRNLAWSRRSRIFSPQLFCPSFFLQRFSELPHRNLRFHTGLVFKAPERHRVNQRRKGWTPSPCLRPPNRSEARSVSTWVSVWKLLYHPHSHRTKERHGKNPSIHFGTLIHSNQPWSGFHCDFWTIIPRFGWVRKEDPIKAPCHGTVEVKNNLKKYTCNFRHLSMYFHLSPVRHLFFQPEPMLKTSSAFTGRVNVKRDIRVVEAVGCGRFRPSLGRSLPSPGPTIKEGPRSRDRRLGLRKIYGRPIFAGEICRFPEMEKIQPLISINLRFKKSRIMSRNYWKSWY